MRVVIVHDSVSASDRPDALDVVVQARAVATALEELGHSVEILPCTLDLAGLCLKGFLTWWNPWPGMDA